MLIYAESSAVVAWLLDREGRPGVVEAIGRATRVSCSALTLLETHRSIRRRHREGGITAGDLDRASASLLEASGRWFVAPLTAEVMEAARRPFPQEPVRSLDAIHLATILALGGDAPGLVVLTLDRRVAANSALLGFKVLPAEKSAGRA